MRAGQSLVDCPPVPTGWRVARHPHHTGFTLTPDPQNLALSFPGAKTASSRCAPQGVNQELKFPHKFIFWAIPAPPVRPVCIYGRFSLYGGGERASRTKSRELGLRVTCSNVPAELSTPLADALLLRVTKTPPRRRIVTAFGTPALDAHPQRRALSATHARNFVTSAGSRTPVRPLSDAGASVPLLVTQGTCILDFGSVARSALLHPRERGGRVRLALSRPPSLASRRWRS